MWRRTVWGEMRGRSLRIPFMPIYTGIILLDLHQNKLNFILKDALKLTFEFNIRCRQPGLDTNRFGIWLIWFDLTTFNNLIDVGVVEFCVY